jgi:uncharacterized damage-inducible protein DinB
MIPTIIHLFERELAALKTQINDYPDEQSLWLIKGDIKNSGGNLCLHLIGNLNHFIGTILGNTGYVRQREAEFSLKNVPRTQLLQDIDATATMVRNVLEKLSPEQLADNFPIPKHNQIVSMAYMLLHLLTHFNYHLGQINYHRRLL